MRRALELAQRGQGAVEPNPMVGAVVVRDDQLLGEGWHQRYGGPHAEIHALSGIDARGATLFVTLEPCCHHGKTPPCTDAVLASGVSRVVVAMRDPFPRVSGQGIASLQQAGIAVEVGLCENEARRLNAPYLKLLSTGQPWVIAKWAMTLDGRIATRTGQSQWISNSASRQAVHRLRGRVDGVLVGIGTALADDPLLTARPAGPRTATRIVLDRHLRLPRTSQLVQTARQYPTLVYTTTLAGDERRAELERSGCEVVALPHDERGVCIRSLLDDLGRRPFTNLLVEGGGEVLGSFRDADAIDEVHLFLSPRLMGGRDALSPILGLGVAQLAEMPTFSLIHLEQLDGDLYLQGRKQEKELPPQEGSKVGLY